MTTLKYSNLIVPIAVWTDSPPSHNITSAVFLGNNALATGSETGLICIWSISSTSLVPQILLSGHTKRVSSLIYDTFDDNQSLVSLSIDGTICVWDVKDGLCMASADGILAKYQPNSMASVGDRKHILVSGRSHKVAVFNVLDMMVQTELTSHDDWVTGVYCCNIRVSDTEHVALSLSSGILRFWALKEYERPTTAIQTIVLDMKDLKGVSLCPTNTTFIAVSKRYWSLFTASNSHKMEDVECPYECGWEGGSYIDSFHVVIWTNDGNACMYRIPDISRLQPINFGDSPSPPQSPSAKNSLPALEALPSSIADQSQSLLESACPSPNLRRAILLHHFLLEDNSIDILHSRLLGSQVVGCCSGEYLCLADERGTVNIWKIPHETLYTTIIPKGGDLKSASTPGNTLKIHSDLLDLQLFTESISTPSILSSPSVLSEDEVINDKDKIKYSKNSLIDANFDDIFPLITSNISNGWGKKNMLELGPITEKENQVTASCIINDDLILVCGYNNGDIKLFNLPTDTNPKIFPRSHNGKVTALLSVKSRVGDLLISGGEDCCIHVWELETGEKLNTWAQHCGVILELLLVPSSSSNHQTKGRFLSISSDFSIGLYSYEALRTNALNMFTGHPAPITSVKMRIDQDYLFVHCEDSTVTIWELSTGNYEGCYSLDDVNDIVSIAIDLSSPLPDIHSQLQNQIYQSTTLYSSESQPPAPFVNTLLLNIKLIINESYLQSPALPSTPVSSPPTSPGPIPSPLHPSPLSPSAPSSGSSLLMAPSSPARTVSAAPLPPSSSTLLSFPPPSKVNIKTLFQLFTYLIPWGVNDEIDECCIALGFSRPSFHVSSGLYGDKGKLSFFIPNKENKQQRFSTSGYATSLYSLACVSYTKTLLQLTNDTNMKNNFSKILAFYCSHIPEYIPNYQLPCLGFLTNFWNDKIDDLQQSSKSLFFSTLNKQSESLGDYKDLIINYWYQKMRISPQDFKSKAYSAIVLGIILCDYLKGGNYKLPMGIPSDVPKKISENLLRLIQSTQVEYSLQIQAAEILTSGFGIWGTVSDVAKLISYILSLIHQPPEVGKFSAPERALFQIAVFDTPGYIHFIHELSKSKSFMVKEHLVSLNIFAKLIKKSPTSLIADLPIIIECVMKALDPRVPQLRERCLKIANSVLYSIVAAFPMASFDLETQRLAIGTLHKQILIYDLRHCTRLFVLADSHEYPISAISFSTDGKLMASYSLEESTVRIWTVAPSVWGFGSAPPKCLNRYVVSEKLEKPPLEKLLRLLKLEWTSAKTVKVTAPGDHQFNVQVNI